jgi:hypothetical protein
MERLFFIVSFARIAHCLRFHSNVKNENRTYLRYVITVTTVSTAVEIFRSFFSCFFAR